MQHWEYEIVTCDAKKLHKDEEKLAQIKSTLNQLGREGWEVVSGLPMNVTQGLDLGGSTKAYTFVLKRLVSSG